MMSTKESDWESQCIYKLEYYLKEVEYLKQKNNFDYHDQIRINHLLNILKSPMEYATLAKYLSKKTTAYLPYRKIEDTDKEFENKIKLKLGYVDEQIFLIYNTLYKNDLYRDFNDMQNNEKHTSINVHSEKIIENTGYMVLGNGIVINNCTTEKTENSNQKSVVWNGEEIDLSSNKGYWKVKELYFEYVDQEVFAFLDDVYQMVNNFVIDIREYINSH